jgi:small subunit ribosomal protein S27Ae
MAEKKPAGKAAAAPAKKSGAGYRVSKVYEIGPGRIKLLNKKCPKCQVFLANHKDRWTCGKCGYMEKK